jgi:D-amino-acid dehydrogenase
MIVPSHLIPMAAPGMISKGIRWMFNSSSPFYVRPRFDLDLLRWGLLFFRNSTEEHVRRAAPALRDLSIHSKAALKELTSTLPADISYAERGLMMLYQSGDIEKEEAETAAMANRHGIEARILSPADVQALEPDVEVIVRGGVFFPGDAHMIPQNFMRGLKEELLRVGVTLISSAEVSGIEAGKHVNKIITRKGPLEFDHYVLAAGSWSGVVAKNLGMRLPIQAGKGYSFLLENVERNIRIPSILLEGRVAATPMGRSLRFGGTLEISGLDPEIDMKRVKGIVDTIPKFYPGIRPAVPRKSEVWYGFRPCTPDGLPYIGRSVRYPNLIVATGHAMLGLSLAAGTGRIVADLISERRPQIEIDAFRPERFDRSRRSRS